MVGTMREGEQGLSSTSTASVSASRRGTSALLVLALLATLGLSIADRAPAAAEGPGTRGKVAGFGITTSSGGVRAVTLEAGRMAATGANTVSLEATWEVDRQDSNEPRRTERTVSDDDLLLAARRAREAGLNVMMTVKIVCQGCPGPSARWRGVLRPSNRDVFFANYRVMINHYADLAQQAGAVLFFVGSEMNSLQGETDSWRQVIFEARQRFRGSIGYQANWDALTGIGFWDEVDIAGVSAYFPLSDELAPNISDLLAAWSDSDTEAHRGSNWVAQLEEFARGHRKPVLFGEIGYQSAVQAAQRPFQQEKSGGYDAQLQADLYQTALTLFEDRPWWLGVIWWEYKITSADEGDYDYSPRGKLAEQLLTSWYSGRRPASREQSLVGTTRPSAKSDGQPRATGPAKPPTVGPGASAPRPVAPKPAPAAPPPPSAAPSPTGAGVAAAPLPPIAPSTSTDVQAAPELPPVLADIEVQTVDDALARAAERQERERASVVAAGLLVPLLLGHAFGLYRRMRRPNIFAHGPLHRA